MRVLWNFIFLGVAICSTTTSFAEYDLERIARGLDRPVKYISIPGSDRAWVVEQDGYVRLLVNDELQSDVVLDLSARVYSTRSETGLLGLAMHPNFPTDNRVFVNYTALEGRQIVSRISAILYEDNQLQPASEEVLLSFDQPFSNHNGGDVVFGPDGYLYIGVGDGGSGGDPQGNGQNLATLLGSILRIDIDTDTGYSIPTENPFVGNNRARPEIFAYGIRNPWGMNFNEETGELWVADVGQDREEEINIVRSGGNYGWNIVEGSLCFPRPGCVLGDYASPLHTYTRSAGASITGGKFYRGQNHTDLFGTYIFADFESGRLWSLALGEDDEVRVTELMETGRTISAISTDNNGELVIVDHGGRLYRLIESR